MPRPVSRYVRINLGGKQYKLRFDFNAIADIEEHLRTDIVSLRDSPLGKSTHVIRVMLWAALRHENPRLAVREAGNIIAAHLDQDGTVDEVLEALNEAMNASGLFGDEEEGAEPDEGNAPGPEAGTGSGPSG